MASLKLIVLGCCFLAACQASAPVINTHFASAVPGEFIVVLKPGSVGLSASTPQVTILNSFHINDFRALHVKVDDVQLAALREDTNVKVIEAETHEFHADCNSQTSGASIWGLSRTSSRPLPEFTGATYDWTDEDDGSGVNAYVIDTGIYLGHQDYAGRVSHGFTAPGISEGDDDLNGHGTHCAGTVGGTTYGVAKGVNLIAVKVLNRAGSGSTTDVVSGVEYVANQHNSGDKTIMNLSLGMTGTSIALNEALTAAIAAGANAAVAAGNSNADACNYSPAQVETALTTVASNNADGLPTFTNYGTCCDIIAPGNNILSTYIGGPTATASLSGTSMAAPHVAGWVARYLSSQSSAPTPAAVKTALQSTATPDVITLGSKVGTPNYLVYAAC
ncbi:hypothetical protein CAPTEDRAFT_169944 [Capitella teleta]|jgi:cerevisin|uniref:Peptidase S8/S53 domain-containing protein n=1 Tax=Capitella teleta TaxID=283909 RepID=R7VGI8_CAPTE|nr:hypothetical protein CAPTEDRAFT_184079 [Capitella teleta]ELU17968.1 hypothetical protein CAPTEDRAFT_169944 [Capitella teleta]|eukprot:ELT99098.1 hypothetical protein CAPTEDRAFT_184079 [Capitella teleta]